MKSYKREISKEKYDKVMEASKGNGYVPSSMEHEFFSESQLIGYGVYLSRVFEKDGTYYLAWDEGDSCD